MKSFVNGDSLYSCGWAKTEVFKYDNVMPRFNARSVPHMWFENATSGRRFLKYGEKNLRFQKYLDTWVKYDLKTLRVDAESF